MEWISVKDRLPENEDLVMVCCIIPDILASVLFQRIRNWIFIGKFIPERGWEVYYNSNNINVTHWMPIPEMPNIPEKYELDKMF